MNKNIILIACTILVFGMSVQSGIASQGYNASNTTATATVSEAIDVSLSYSNGLIDFGTLAPNTFNNSGNTTLIIQINPTTNVKTNISMAASGNFSDGGSNYIPISNLIYNNLSYNNHSMDSNVSMTLVYATPFPDWINIPKPIGVSQDRNSSFYLSIPDATLGGIYTTNININVTRSHS
jgi:hypothetical protein